MRIVTLMEDTQGNKCCGYEHGLCVYVETGKHKILVDTGATGLFMENAKKLQVALETIDTVILSHGHYDHSGGMLEFVKINKNAKIYMQRKATGSYYHGERYIGIDPEIQKLPQVILLDNNYEIDEELSLFTNITGRRYWPKSNMILSRKEGEKLVQDEFEHEQCLVIHSEEGDVLISGCAHNGILNIIDKYKEIYEKEPETVISGFHMMKKTDYDEEEVQIIQDTAKELRKMKTKFYTGHCTGEKAFSIMKSILKEQLEYMRSGNTLYEN